MSRPIKIILILLVSIITTVLFGFVAIMAAGAGHGTYAPFCLFFPYIVIGVATVEYMGINPTVFGPIFMACGIVQYPLYSVVLARYLGKKNWNRALCVIIGIHIVGAVVALCVIASSRYYH